MTFDVSADLVQAYAARSTLQIYKEAPLLQLFDNSWANNIVMGDNGYVAKIPNPDLTGITIVSRTRAADYTIATQVGQSFIDLALDQHAGDDVVLHYLDERETPLNYVEAIRRDLAAKASNYIDQNLLDYVEGLTIASGRQIESTATAANSVYDVSEGAYGSKVGELLFGEINDYGDELMSMGAIRGIGERPSTPTCIMSVKQYRQVANYMLAQKYSLDTLTQDILQSSSIFGSDAYRGSINGVALLVSDKMPTPTATSEAYMWFVCRQSVGVAKLPDFISIIDPGANQSRRGWDFHYQVDFGRIEVVGDLTYRGGVQSQA